MAACTFAVGTPDTNVSPNTSGSFTPAVGDLLVAFVSGTATAVDGQLTSSVGGFTFSLVGRAIWAASAHSLCCFVSNALVSSATPQTVTAAFSGDESNGTTIVVYRVSGMTKTGLTAVRQSAKQDNQLAATTPGPTFAGVCLTTNPVLGALANNHTPAAVTEPSGWAEGVDTGYSTPSAGTQAVSIDSGFTSATVTWGSTYGANGCTFVVELDASGSATKKGGFGLMGMGR